MVKRFFLIRHGDKVRIPGDPPLSDLGIEQAKKTGHHLKTIPITKIVASPIKRTQETANYISDILDLEFDTNELLRERANWGDDPDQSIEDFLEMWEKASQDRHWQPPVGDSSMNAGKRIQKIISELLDDENDENIALITHGGIIADFLRNILTDEELLKFTEDTAMTFDNSIKECSITIVEMNGDKQKIDLLKLADTNHLDG